MTKDEREEFLCVCLKVTTALCVSKLIYAAARRDNDMSISSTAAEMQL